MADKRGCSRVLSKLQDSIAAGNYYEAHQMYKTLYFRYMNQKKYVEAIDLIYSGATTLLKYDQHESGTDLSLLLIDIMNKASTPITDSILENVANLHALMDPCSSDRHSYVAAALRYTSKVDSEYKTGHPELHKRIALNLWKEKNYGDSRFHFLHSADGESCAEMLIEFHVTKGYASEVDIFIAQTVLQYLCLKNKITASVVFYTYTEKHPQINDEGPPFKKPLLNFLWLLLLAVEGGKLAVFTVLVEKYQPSLKRDSSYNEYLDRIGQLFFGIPAPPSSFPGIFGNLIQSLFGDEDEEDGPAAAAGTSASASSPVAKPVQITNEELD